MPLVKPHTKTMTLADKITGLRLVLAPLFFILFFLPDSLPVPPWLPLAVLWLLFIISEITDLLDGKVARARNEVSDFGKLFDPFCDTLVRLTYFLCFVVEGILPALLLLLVIYREFGIQFLRTLMMKKGIAMGARKGGKIKSVLYMLTGVFALIALSIQRLSLNPTVFRVFKWISISVFTVSVVLAVLSFLDYVNEYKKVQS